MRAEVDGDRLSDEEICATCGILMTAGHETTSNLIGTGLLALLRHPEQLARLRDEPGLMASAVEELLRYSSPVQWTARLAMEDREVGGVRISRGEVVMVGNAAADRDPAQFSAPDALDLGRSPNRHLAFGHGVHFCMGAALTRMEGQIVFQTLLRRMSNPAACCGRDRVAAEFPGAWPESAAGGVLRTIPLRNRTYAVASTKPFQPSAEW